MELIGAVMPMNTSQQARLLSSSAGPPIQIAITPCRIIIALFTSVLSRSNTVGLQRHWTMDFALPSLWTMLGSGGSFVVGQNLSAPALSYFTTAASRWLAVIGLPNRRLGVRSHRLIEAWSNQVAL